jgi:hypothetical protein
MPLSRKISRVVTVPPIGPGFAGPAHIATTVIPPGDFEATDPFFRMMDDRVSVAGQFGGEHPHAGLETVTFILSGTMLGDFENRFATSVVFPAQPHDPYQKEQVMLVLVDPNDARAVRNKDATLAMKERKFRKFIK